MEKSKVYFCDMSTGMRESILTKFERLIRKAGIERIDFKDKYVAIKIHFGEEGNLAYLRHNYAARLVSVIKSLGGKPFLTDCNTLYVGSRTNALDHLECASNHGYSFQSLGCQVLIADGLRGTTETLVPIKGEYVREAKIGTAIMDADIVISLNHFKGHEATGFGGAIKNLGMGSGSRAGKMEMHYSGKPSVDAESCVGCGNCARSCGQNAISITGSTAHIDDDICAGCGRCIGQCPTNAIEPNVENSVELLSKRIAEYAWAVTKDRPTFHINIAIDISPLCDCYSCNDLAIVPDVGMFASFDPVAVDCACADACNRMSAVPGSRLDKHIDDFPDHFKAISHGTDWHVCLSHCEKLGMGTEDYELVTL